MSKKSPMVAAGSFIGSLKPAGPTVEKFILDFDHRVQGIMGPVGGGKTTGCIQKIDVISAIQPVCLDGVIRSRGVVVRQSFRELEKTVLNSWWEWFPREMKDPITGADMWDFTGGNDRPAIHTRRWNSARGIIESVTEFVGIGAHRIEEITRGAMWTWAWPNEWDLLHKDIMDAIDQRLPRFPPKRLLPPDQEPIPFLIGDFNAPDIDNWTYRDFVEKPIKGYHLYQQPGGMEPNAENKHNLPRGYYENMLATKPEWWCRRFVHNQFGYSRLGEPVYPEFVERKHVAPTELAPLRGTPIRLGVDGGGSPAAIFLQKAPDDMVHVLDEVVAYPGTGPKRFGRDVAAMMASEKYSGCEFEVIIADPTTMDGADREDGGLAWLEIFAAAIGVQWRPHYTNEPSLRQAPVRDRLERSKILYSPVCRKTVAGMAYGYHFQRMRSDPDAPLKLKPEKNDFSHPVEAHEYGVSSFDYRTDIIKRAGLAHQRFNEAVPNFKRQTPGDFDPFRV